MRKKLLGAKTSRLLRRIENNKTQQGEHAFEKFLISCIWAHWGGYEVPVPPINQPRFKFPIFIDKSHLNIHLNPKNI